MKNYTEKLQFLTQNSLLKELGYSITVKELKEKLKSFSDEDVVYVDARNGNRMYIMKEKYYFSNTFWNEE